MAARGRSRAPDDRRTAWQARQAALIIAGTMLLWLGAQAIGGALAWPLPLVFLFDFAALAGLFWGLVVTYQVWRGRRATGPGAGQGDRT